jgi:hypothetical protein
MNTPFPHLTSLLNLFLSLRRGMDTRRWLDLVGENLAAPFAHKPTQDHSPIGPSYTLDQLYSQRKFPEFRVNICKILCSLRCKTLLLIGKLRRFSFSDGLDLQNFVSCSGPSTGTSDTASAPRFASLLPNAKVAIFTPSRPSVSPYRKVGIKLLRKDVANCVASSAQTSPEERGSDQTEWTENKQDQSLCESAKRQEHFLGLQSSPAFEAVQAFSVCWLMETTEPLAVPFLATAPNEGRVGDSLKVLAISQRQLREVDASPPARQSYRKS